MGARIERGDDWIEARAGEGLRAVDWDCTSIPDAAMTAAVVAMFAPGRTTLRGIGSWRVKETDRIAAMATELRKLGAAVEEGADRISVGGPTALREATIDTYDDHRIAMCFALAATGGVPVHIRDPRCVAETNDVPRLPPLLASGRSWKPDDETWDAIKLRSVERTASVTVTGYGAGDHARPGVPLRQAGARSTALPACSRSPAC